jgi:D-3-phosphoglycerate dehydrogenase
LVIRHADRVGVLAGILDHLRQAHVNVQEMENIIFQGAHAACARIQVDRPPAAETLAKIGESPDIFATSIVALAR